MGIEIECKFVNSGWTVGVSSSRIILYTCRIPSASITKPGTRVTSFKGEHQPGKSNNDVEAINFTNVVVHYFPLGLDKIFPNLSHLQIGNCGLKEISRRDLIGLESLTSLCLQFNELQSLPSNLFNRMTNLIELEFNNNKLDFMSSKLLRPIMNNKLQIVDFGSDPSPKAQFKAGPYIFKSAKELCDYIDKNYMKPV